MQQLTPAPRAARPWLVDVRNGVAWRSRVCTTEDEAIAVYRQVSADLAQAVKAGVVADGETVLSDPMGRIMVRWSMSAPRVLS